MLILKNKKALFNNEVLEKYLAGISLRGYEVKAIREKKASFEGSFVSIEDGSAWLKNMHIGKYSKQSQEYSEDLARRPRRLLLSSRELFLLQREVSEKGKTAVPLALLLKNGMIKLEFAVVKGRKKHEKKQYLKERQQEIDLRKEVKDKRLF